MKNKQARSLFLSAILLTLLALLIAGCQPQPLAGPDPTQVAASVEAHLAQATQPVLEDATPEFVMTPEPQAVDTGSPVETLLPAPLYFLSGASGIDQIWRIEMNGGFAHPVTDLPAPVTTYDISPVDGRLAYVSGNDLYIANPDGSSPQMLVDGQDVDPQMGNDAAKSISSPLWSPDGKELAYSLNGLNILTLETGSTRSLITNVIAGLDNVAAWRTYFPAFWSPDGRFIATQVGYYEGLGLMIMPASGGEPVDLNLYSCCDIIQSEDPGAFYIASATYGYSEPGLWRVEWDGGETTRLSEEQPDISNPNLATYSHPHLFEGELYFMQAVRRWVAIARSRPADLPEVEHLTDVPYYSMDALWSPDASLLVVTGLHPGLPMQIWWTSGEQRPLETPGRSMKWGIPTEADIAFAATPVPLPAPVVIPALPPSAQPITAGNVNQLQVLGELDKDEWIYSVAISPDGKLLALGLQNRVHIYDLQTMERAAELKPYLDIIPALDFSPDSRYLAVGSWDNSLDLWEMGSYQKAKSFEGHTDSVAAVEFSPDGRLLASASNDRSMIIWDVEQGAQTYSISTDNWIGDVDFSTDGRVLAAAVWNEAALLLDPPTLESLGTISRPDEEWVLNLAFSPDSQTLVLGAWNYDVVLYDMASRSVRAVLSGHRDNPTGIDFSADGRLLATADEGGQLRFWDMTNGSLLREIVGTRILDISSDGRLLVAGGAQLEGVVLYYVP